MTWSVSSSFSQLSNRLFFSWGYFRRRMIIQYESFKPTCWINTKEAEWRKWILTTWPVPPASIDWWPDMELSRCSLTGPHPLSHWWPLEEMVTGADSLASISHRLGEARGNNRWQSQSTDGEDSWNIGILLLAVGYSQFKTCPTEELDPVT